MNARPPDIPIDPLLGDWRRRLAPQAVLEACREQLRRVDGAARRAWRCALPIEALMHPGRYLRTAYVLLEDPHTPARRRWPEGQIVYLHAPARRPISRRGQSLRLDGAAVEAYAFPNDRRLRGLRRFAGRATAARIWQRWIDQNTHDPFRIDGDSLQRLFVRYVPEQKWIVRLRAEGRGQQAAPPRRRRIAVRSAAPRACALLAERHRSLATAFNPRDGAPRVPDVVGLDLSTGLLALEWVRGDPLLDVLRAGDPDEALRRVASALHCVHALPGDDLPRISAADLTLRVQDALHDLGTACPEMRDELRSLLRLWRARSADLPVAPSATLHGDFHSGQVQIRHGRVVLMDLERMARGDPLIDVANFAAQLRMLAHRPERHISAASAEAWAAQLLAAWSRRAGPAEVLRLTVYETVARLDLARGMMRHLRPGWRALARRCVRTSLACLDAPQRTAVTP